MTVKIDVLALAREAGFEVYCDKNKNRHAWVEGVRCTHDLVQFATLVLERAALECDKQMEREAYGHAKHAVCCAGDAIRAIKPVLEKGNT